jgi:hypothetical protein
MGRSFLVVTAHCVILNQEQLTIIFLSFVAVFESHTSDYIKKYTYDMLDLVVPEGHKGKNVGLTTDNGADVKKVGLTSCWRWISCFAHSLLLLVKAAFDVSLNTNRAARRLLA